MGEVFIYSPEMGIRPKVMDCLASAQILRQIPLKKKQGKRLEISPAVKTLGSLNIRSHEDDETITGEGNGATTLRRSPFKLTQ